MIDSVPYGMQGMHTFECPYTGARFPFERDRKSKAEAFSAQQRCTRAEIERREKLAGRKLSHRDLLNGIEHVDTRSVEEKIKAENPPPEPAPKKPHWSRARADYLRDHPGHTPGERERTRRRIKELEAVAKQHEAQAEKQPEQSAPDPRVKDALAHAESIRRNMMYSRDSTMADISRVQQLRKTAGMDVDKYWQEFELFSTDWKARGADASALDVTAAIAEASDMHPAARQVYGTEASEEI